jgi:hypothetical protein
MSFRKRINNVLFIDFVYCERMLEITNNQGILMFMLEITIRGRF